jgi:hypothetical protein
MRYAKAVSPLATGIAVVALATECLAASDEETKAAVSSAPKRARTSEVLLRIDEPRAENRSWIQDHVSIRKGMGLAYSYKMKTEDGGKVVLTVGGPALKKKRLGLMFEVRF